MKNIKTYVFISVFLLVVLILPNLSSAATTEEIHAQIKSLMAQIEALKSQLAQLQSQNTAWCHDFNRNLKIEEKGEEIAVLQTVLEKEGFAINEDEKSQSYFGESTASAVVGLQEKYNEDILKPFNLQRGTGFVGKFTRLKLNNLYGCSGLAASSTTSSITPTTNTISILATTTSSVTVLYPNSGISMPQTGSLKASAKIISSKTSGTLSWYLIGEKSGYKRLVTTQNFSPTSSNNTAYATIDFPTSTPVGSDYKVKVDWVSSDGLEGLIDTSDNFFSITLLAPTVVFSPNGGEQWQIGINQTVKWTTQSGVSVLVDLYKGNTFIKRLSNGYVGGSSLSVNVGSDLVAGNDYKIKITTPTLSINDWSDAPFSIVAAALSINAQKLDYNNDNVLDINDTTFLSNVSVGNNQCPINKVCDINKDGKADISDVILLQRIVLGLDPVPDFSTTNILLNVSLASDTIQNTVIAGAQQNTFAHYNLSANDSAEDVNVTSIQLSYQGSGNPTGLTNCRLYDGSTILNTDVNVVNPSSFSQYLTFYLGTGSKVTKGTIKKITLKCDINSNASGSSYQWGIDAAAKISAVGISSGNVASYTITGASGTVVNVVSSGALSVSLDASTPLSTTWPAVSMNVPATALKFTTMYEGINLQSIALQFDGSNPNAMQKYTVWDGSVKVGESVFVGNPSVLTFSSPISIPADYAKKLTIKVDLAQVGTGQPAQVGDTVAVNYDGDNWQMTKGVGQTSGVIIYSSTKTDTSANKITLGSSATTTSLSINAQKLDYNNDNVLDINDTTFLSNVSVGNNQCPINKVCDINKDGKADISDVILLQRIVLGLDPVPDFSTTTTNTTQASQTANILNAIQDILIQLTNLLKK